jgi:hypothetical protein
MPVIQIINGVNDIIFQRRRQRYNNSWLELGPQRTTTDDFLLTYQDQ